MPFLCGRAAFRLGTRAERRRARPTPPMEKLSANRDRGHGTLVAKFPNLEGTDFEGCGEDVGLAVWRVVKRKLVRAEDLEGATSLS